MRTKITKLSNICKLCILCSVNYISSMLLYLSIVTILTPTIRLMAIYFSTGADVQCGRGLDTPLHAACRVGGAKEAELLFEHGADRTSRNSEGKRPLDLTSDQSIKHLLQTAGNEKKHRI